MTDLRYERVKARDTPQLDAAIEAFLTDTDIERIEALQFGRTETGQQFVAVFYRPAGEGA